MRKSARYSVTCMLLALLPAAAFAAKETARLELQKVGKVFDTVLIRMDYDEFPQAASHVGKPWPDMEIDSTWTVDGLKGAKYSHSFLAMMDGRHGFGFTYISYQDIRGGEPQDITNCSFVFHGEAYEAFSWEPGNFRKHGEFGSPLGSESYGSYVKVINGVDVVAPTAVRLLEIVPGWVDDLPVPVISSSYQSARHSGTRGDRLVQWGSRPIPWVPEEAAGVRVFDVRGRLIWENLQHPK